jgi:hypothetical protein
VRDDRRQPARLRQHRATDLFGANATLGITAVLLAAVALLFARLAPET